MGFFSGLVFDSYNDPAVVDGVFYGPLRYVPNDGHGQLLVGYDDTVGQAGRQGALLVDGQPNGTLDAVPMLYGMAPFEGITVGRDPRSPVSWPLHEQFGSFPYTGRLARVAYEPGELAPDAADNLVGMLREMGMAFE